MTPDPDNTGRDQSGRFSPGCSGNPAGKPAGTRHKATRAALALLNGEVDKLTRKAIELALAGDVTALRLCIERLVPPCREAPVCLDLPPLEKISDTPRLLSFLLTAVARGEVTPTEAEKMAGLVFGWMNLKKKEPLDVEALTLQAREIMGRLFPQGKTPV